MNRATQQKRTGESGSILIIAMLMVFAASVIVISLSAISSQDIKISGNQRMGATAFNVAEAGLTEAIHRLSLPDPTTETIGGWTGNIAIGDSEPYDPDWEARIYLTDPGSAPGGGGGSIVNTGTIQDPNGDYMDYSVGSGSNDVLSITHKWRDRDGDGNRDANEIVRYDPEQIPPENFNSGFPVEIVTVTGRSGNATRTVQAEVTRKTLLARTLGAIYTDKAIDITGNPAICGHNHDVNTPVGSRPNGCFAWHLGSGHLPGITTTGDAVDVSGAAADIVGDPAPTDTSSTNPFYSLADVLGLSASELSEVLANADHTSIADPLNGITYINGDLNLNSNLVGSGLLYVTGDLTGNGNFEYKGLVYVEGDLKLTGTPWILGSIIVKGSSDYNFSAGNAAVLYSKDAIQTYIGRSMPALVLSWREL